MPLLFGVTLFGLGVLDVTRLLFILWHSANRATRASCRGSSASVCPFHLQDGRFIASNVGWSAFYGASSVNTPGGRVVSAPLPRLSPYAPRGCCNSTCGRSFLRPSRLDPKATHQLASPKPILQRQPINASHTLDCKSLKYL